MLNRIRRWEVASFTEKPSSRLAGGGIGEVYHQGDFKVTGTSGNTYIYEGTGSIWIIWRKGAPRYGKVDFSRIKGSVQQCFDRM